MILELVKRTLVERLPEMDKLYEFVTREIYLTLKELRKNYNVVMALINGGTFPLGGGLANQGIRFVMNSAGTLTIGNDDDAVGNFAIIDISDTHKILFGPVWILTGTEFPADDPITLGAPTGSIYMRHNNGGEPLITFWVYTPSPLQWTAIA